MKNNKKILIAYYSHSGNTKFIAETMSKEVGADLIELTPKKKLNASGIGYFGWGIRQLVRKDDREIEEIPFNVEDYDLVIIGTPVWTYTLTPPVRIFLKENNFKGRAVGVFCCHEGDYSDTLEDMVEHMPESNCIGKIDFMGVLKDNKTDSANRAKQWIRTLCDSLVE